MNFGIEVNNDGSASMTWDKSENIVNNVWLSLNTEQGSQFNNKSFGLKLSDIKKISANNIDLIYKRVAQALEWIKTLGRAKSIIVKVEKNLFNVNRIDYQVEIVQSDGIPITVNNFITVGGPSSGFTVS